MYTPKSAEQDYGTLHTHAEKAATVLTEWNDTIWSVMIGKAIVHRDKSITFVFYNGSEVKVEE